MDGSYLLAVSVNDLTLALMANETAEIDAAGRNPEAIDRREELVSRLRSVG